jgi:hypothetical protein
MTGRIEADGFQVARFVLRLTFVILSCVGISISALLVALAFALERLYLVAALPWAFATLALPACALVLLAFSTPLARFVAGASTGTAFAPLPTAGSTESSEPNKPLQPTRAAQPNGQREPSGSGPRG